MDELLEAAGNALSASYVPYSNYRVGAAIRTASGSVYVGCNLENANYTNSLHAEALAIAEAVKNGHTEFDALAVVSGERDGVTPCGTCRQTLSEFCDPSLPIYCGEGDRIAEYTLGELLPNAAPWSTGSES